MDRPLTPGSFEIEELLARLRESGSAYLECLRVPDLSLGVYVLPPGGTDPQQPHGEDEVYFVLRGRGRFRAGSEEQEVGPGTILFVAAGEAHHFHSITEELALLVFFGPAEGSRRG